MSLRAEDEAQTRDPQLGRLMLYQLSYFRITRGRRWIRTTEGINQQIYSLPHLATLVFAQILLFAVSPASAGGAGASCRIRTNDPELTTHVLWPTELKRRVFCLSFAALRPQKRLQSYAHFLYLQTFPDIFLSSALFFSIFLRAPETFSEAAMAPKIAMMAGLASANR